MSQIRKLLTPRLSQLCQTYRSELVYCLNNKDKLKEFILENSGRNYYFEPDSLGSKIYPSIVKKKNWITLLRKMNPIKYALEMNDTTTLKKGLLFHHNSQVNFASKMFPILDKDANYDRMIDNYSIFLELCRKNVVIVPTLIEDFVWHAHMTDHDAYVIDSKKIFGKVLNHSLDIDEKQKEKSNQLRKELVKNSQESQNSSSSIGGCGGLLDPLNPLNRFNPASPYYNNHHNHYAACASSCSNCSSSCSSNCSSCGSSCSSCSSCSSGCGGD